MYVHFLDDQKQTYVAILQPNICLYQLKKLQKIIREYLKISKNEISDYTKSQVVPIKCHKIIFLLRNHIILIKIIWKLTQKIVTCNLYLQRKIFINYAIKKQTFNNNNSVYSDI